MKIKTLPIRASVLITIGAFTSNMNAAVLLNGDLDGTPGISSTPTSWNAATGTPDLTNPGGISDAVFRYANFAPASPNGGTFVIVQTNNTVEGFRQTVTGLIPGQSYQISFFQSLVALTTIANPAVPIFTDPSQWRVTFSGSSQLSPLESFTGLGTQVWTPVTLTGFIATTNSETLNFTSVLPAGSTQSYLGIDGVAIQPIPEPSVQAILLAGLVALATVRRRI